MRGGRAPRWPGTLAALSIVAIGMTRAQQRGPNIAMPIAPPEASTRRLLAPRGASQVQFNARVDFAAAHGPPGRPRGSDRADQASGPPGRADSSAARRHG